MTVKVKGGENDSSSKLNRENVYRVNLGVYKDTFKEMFRVIPKRSGKDGIVDMDYDFSVSDQILPYPVYVWMGWICVLNPSVETFRK